MLAGANGAGKTTAAPRLLKGLLTVEQYVNADTIARGLAGFNPDDAALAAGRLMLDRARELVSRRLNFAIETTLAGRSLAAWLRDTVHPSGYESHLVYLWLPSVEVAVARIQARVRLGGHDVPQSTARRRYVLGAKNLMTLYIPLVTTWRVYDSGAAAPPELIACGARGGPTHVLRPESWVRLNEQASE